jgi:hypothetical protein
MRTKVQVTIGYLYKVLKNGKDTSKFKEEFEAIRHGDYETFLSLIGDKIDFIVSYNNGVISNDVNIREDDSDFARLIKSGSSLNTFVKICIEEFGKIDDCDLTNLDFERLALFELSLKMHRNNNAPRENKLRLENVINHLQIIKNLSDSEIKILHQGRKFLNKVKHPEKMKSDWKAELIVFNSAYNILLQKQLTII